MSSAQGKLRRHLFRALFLCSLTFLPLLGAGCGSGAASADPDEMVMYYQTSRIRGFDPAKAGDVASALSIARIYEGLLQYSYLERPYKVEPLLAEELPEVSEDGLVYTFKIRKGIYFQDDPCFEATNGKGRELTAGDFVYSIKRIADVRAESTGFWVYNKRIAGLNEFRDASRESKTTDYDAPVEGLQALDKYTFQMKLTKPYPQLLWILTMHYAYAVPREAVEYYGKDFLNHPVGTGPYRLASWRRQYRVEFERNPKWAETGRVELYPSQGEPGDAEKGLLDDAGKPVPFVDRIIARVIDDTSTQWLKFVTGEMESSGISRDNWNAVLTQEKELSEGLRKMGVRLFSSQTLDVYYIGFNMDDPVVGGNPKEGADPERVAKARKLRQALTCAFNSKEWERFYNNRVARATGPIPPGVAGYDSKPSPYPFDLDKAKKLLAEAGYPDGIDPETGKTLSLKMEVGSAASSEFRQSLELISAFMKKIGVRIELSYNNWPTFLSKMDRRQCQLYMLGWVADYPDAENFLQLFYGPNSSPGPNHSNYENPAFDELYRQIQTMPDGEERTAIYRKMADMVVEDAPWIFMHNPMSYGLYHAWVENYKPHDFPYSMGKYRKINVKTRDEWKKTFGRKHWKEVNE